MATAWQHLYRLCVDVASWSDQEVVAHPKSKREHAIEFIRSALDPVATDDMRKIARDVAHPILRHSGPGRPSDARRDQIIVDAITAIHAAHGLHPTRHTGQAESGCSIVVIAIKQFIAGCRKSPRLRELSRKLFPKGALSENRIANIWDQRTRVD